MSFELMVVVQEGLKKGELRLEQTQDTFKLVVDSKDTLQALMLGLASLPVSNQVG